MNKAILMGRLTKDPEVRYSNEGNASASFTLAVDRKYTKQGEEKQADFINCVAFGKTAEFLEKYIKKGTKIVLDGRIQTGKYTNKDGQTIYYTNVVAESLEFAESKGNANNNAANESNDGFMNLPEGIDEELPFV